MKKLVIDINHEVIFTEGNIIKLEGFNEFNTAYETTSNADGVGVLIIGEKPTSRNMLIQVDVPLLQADTMQRYFKYQNTYTIYVQERMIEARCELSRLIYSNDYASDPVLELGFVAPDPYFKSINNFGKNLAGVVGLFGFPWRATVASGISFGYYEFNKRTTFNNDGDREIGLTVRFKVLNSTASNPSFHNLTTNKFFKINVDLVKDDVLEVDTQAKTVTLNGQNILNKIDPHSSFFLLKIGDNLLERDAETGETNMEVTLYYHRGYMNGLVVI